VGSKLYSILSHTARHLWSVKWFIAAGAAGSVLPDVDHFWHARLWPHSNEAAVVAAGLLGVGLILFCVGMAFSHTGRPHRSRILDEEEDNGET